jgi:hypothetical protein
MSALSYVMISITLSTYLCFVVEAYKSYKHKSHR